MPRTRRVDFTVPASPDAVAARLKAHSRWRLIPYRGSWLGGGQPLGGRVSATGFRLALDPRDLRQRAQAVAIGAIAPDGAGGARITADVGMPPWVTQLFRVTWVASLCLLAAAIYLVTTSAAPALASETAMIGLLLAVAFSSSVFGIGANVVHADDQIDALAATLHAIANGSPAALPDTAAHAETRARPAREVER
jgi:hypothetical protein